MEAAAVAAAAAGAIAAPAAEFRTYSPYGWQQKSMILLT
jgi:hypothetical protein